MFKKLFGLGAAAAAALVTAACDDTVVTQSVYTYPNGTWIWLQSASAKGAVWAEAHHDPFGRDRGAFEAWVTEGLGKAVKGRPVAFTTDKGAAGDPTFRVVVTFDQGDATDPKHLCRGQVPQPGAFDGVHKVMATFCRDDELLAAVRGHVKKGLEPDDKAYTQLFYQLARELFVKPKDD